MPVEREPQTWPLRPLRSDVLLVGGGFAVLAWLAIVIARQPGTVAVVWLANGAAAALIASAPRERFWALLGAAAAGNLAANLAYGDPLSLSLAFLPPNVLEVALAVTLLRRVNGAERFAVEQRSFVAVIAAGALLPPLLGATMGAATLQGLGFARFERVWVDWYVGAAMGAVAVLPLTLSLRAFPGAQGVQRLLFGSGSGLLWLLAVLLTTVLALRTMPYPFVAIGVVLMALAFLQPRLVTFAAVPAVVVTLAAMLALRQFTPLSENTQIGHALIYGAALLAVLPAQLVAVLVARQRAMAEMLSAVGSRTDEIVVFADMAGLFQWVNRAREAYTGQPPDQVLGRHWRANIPPGGLVDVVSGMFEAALAGRTLHRQATVDYPLRPACVMDLTMQPALDEEGRQVGVLSIASDVTAREAARRELQALAEELQVSNRSLEQFVRVASHDLREPMNTVLQFGGLLAEEAGAGALSQRGQLYLSQVQQGSARMKRMLDDVLQYVQVEAGPPEPAAAVPLDQVAAEVVADLQALVQASGGEVRVLAPLGSVQGHRALLQLLLQNLVANALKFSAPGRAPRVTVSVAQDAGRWCLTVADNGIGIDPARRAELGQPFRRLHSRRRYEGTGLGLAICLRIAEQHRGTLEIDSEPGVGSRFSLVLPSSPSP